MTTISTSPPSFADSDIAARLAAVRRRIERAGGDPAGVRVIAVTKGFPADAVAAARVAGLTDVGENYASELREKAPGPPGTRWHFLGSVQRNKVAVLAPLVDVWQGVARLSEGESIARHSPGAEVLVQVNCSDLPGRNGVAPDEVPVLVGELASRGLRVSGLMTVAPPDRAGADAAFRTVRDLADDLGLPERSMGMSDDLEAAVEAGSTMVRIGRALFGERPLR